MAKRRKAPGDAALPTPTPAPETPPAGPTLPPAAYAPALNAGLQAIASRVQEMHQAISGTTFDQLQRVPGLAVPTRIVQGVHDAVSQGVYAAVRHGAGAALSLAAGAERLTTDPTRVPGRKEQGLRSALNAAVGDALADSGSALAVQMSLHTDGVPLPLTPAALATLRPRVCLFIHGLGCDELSWALRTDAWGESAWAHALPPEQPMQYGALLAHELGVSAIALRYNTGLPIDANARRLAVLLEVAARAAPQVREWLPIGHSMGGLVARSAHAIAAAEGLTWAKRTPMIICLGSPHQGAPLERIGHLASAALNMTSVTQPLAKIANARSQGIKDLRHGLKGSAAPAAPPALRLVYATLGDEADSLVGKVLGDGLVMAGSAADEGSGGDVERVELAGLGHMSLLNHPRVYAVIRRWLEAPEIV